MHCFKDFPVSELFQHSQNCKGDMSGPRERFQGFTPSVHDVSQNEKRIYINRSWIETKDFFITFNFFKAVYIFDTVVVND